MVMGWSRGGHGVVMGRALVKNGLPGGGLYHSFLEVFRKIGNGKVGNGTESQKKIGNMDKKVGNRLGMGDKRSGMKRSGMGMNLRKRSGMPAIPDLFSRE